MRVQAGDRVSLVVDASRLAVTPSGS